MSGWCVGNLLPLNGRERLLCMLAASLADVDGLGIVVSEELYWSLHHALGHCLLFGVLLSAILTMFSTRRVLAFVTYLGLFHLHLVLDYFGSGPDWPLYYAWPFSRWEIENDRAWPFFSWQNLSAAAVMLAWTVTIAVRRGRTPLESVFPSLDRKLVTLVQPADVRPPSAAPEASSAAAERIASPPAS